MTDQHAASTAALDDALEQVIQAARAHLTAVQAAGGAIDDDQVWHSYVALNNASFAYDQLLLDTYGEVTPWDTERIDPHDEEQALRAQQPPGPDDGDPYPAVVSVRHRRDYRVPSVAALLEAGTEAARRLALEDALPAPESVAEAVLGMVQAGDGSLASLDVPALEPLDGVVTVTEVAEPLDLSAAGDTDGAELFATGSDDRVVGRLDEHPYLDLSDLDDDLDADLQDGPDGRAGGAEK